MISVESLEAELEPIWNKYQQVLQVLDLKGASTFRKILKLHGPTLEQDVLRLLDMAGEHTEARGHSDRADWVKDKLYEILGQCKNEDLK